MLHVCEYCNNAFSSRTGLYNHKSSAKYCLQNRENEIQKITCQECHKEFSNKRYLVGHMEKCPKYIASLKEQLCKKDAEIATLNSVNTTITKKLIKTT